ncbi:MAG: hypothetical protein JNK21_06455 [Rhodospirillaceae bacterium]|nr:hypothetical protein [Rhodospirillaceae bacterium]
MSSAAVPARSIAAVCCIAAPVLFGLYALTLGQDANWDLQNYHWYNPYAFLTGRLDQDIAPAHVPTFYNPTLDIPFYLAAQVLPARPLSFLLGTVQGLNFVLLYLIGASVFAGLAETERRVAALGVALVGVLGGGHLGLVGTTFYDNIISLCVLGAVAVVIGADRPGLKRLLCAGLLVGVGAGLKLPTAVFAIGLCAACLVIGATFQHRVLNAFVFGLGVLAGFAVFAGHWTLHLWTAYGNPVFPYFNGLFESAMGLPASYRDTRFVPLSAGEAALFPLLMAFDPSETGEIAFRDWRIAAAYLAALLTPVLMLLKGRVARDPSALNTPAVIYICAAMAASYAVWLGLFGIYRYLIPLEMLSPLIVVAVTSYWPGPVRFKTNLAIALMALLVVTAKPGTWGRVPFSETFVTSVPPHIPNPASALVLMAGHTPTAWVIPSFPPEASFVRIQGFINHPSDGDTGLNVTIRQRISTHTGDIYMLSAVAERTLAQSVLAAYGLTLTPECSAVVGNLAPGIEFCTVRHMEDAS